MAGPRRKSGLAAPTRGELMSRIRSKNTAPELAVRRFLHAQGLRFRIHAPLPGRPDIVLPKYRAAVFVHGCFWHGHGCSRCYAVRTNAPFWNAKIARNQERDGSVQARLQADGWRTFTVWECEVAAGTVLSALVEDIRQASTQKTSGDGTGRRSRD